MTRAPDPIVAPPARRRLWQAPDAGVKKKNRGPGRRSHGSWVAEPPITTGRPAGAPARVANGILFG
jgi:hypothetical protein